MDPSLTPGCPPDPSAHADGTDPITGAGLNWLADWIAAPDVRSAKLCRTILATSHKRRRQPATAPGPQRLPALAPDETLAGRERERRRSPRRLLFLSQWRSSSSL